VLNQRHQRILHCSVAAVPAFAPAERVASMQHEARDPLRVARRVGDGDRSPARDPEQCDALQAERVDQACFEARDLAGMQCPVLILRGDKTAPVAARVAQVLAALIGHARLETIPSAGHMAPVTDPGPIAAAILGHLRTAGARAGRSERHFAAEAAFRAT
jgi:pimeloyl-ACP methyl ester carboxylesterase